MFCFGRAETNKSAPRLLAHLFPLPPPYPVLLDKTDNKYDTPEAPFFHTLF